MIHNWLYPWSGVVTDSGINPPTKCKYLRLHRAIFFRLGFPLHVFDLYNPKRTSSTCLKCELFSPLQPPNTFFKKQKIRERKIPYGKKGLEKMLTVSVISTKLITSRGLPAINCKALLPDIIQNKNQPIPLLHNRISFWSLAGINPTGEYMSWLGYPHDSRQRGKHITPKEMQNENESSISTNPNTS